jgi:hypothetical protein
MVLPLSGQISLLSLQNEFGGSNPIGMDEYYSSGGAPGSGQIGINTFYGRFANWTEYMMGNIEQTGTSTTDDLDGNIVLPGSSRSPTTFNIYFDRNDLDHSGTLYVYINGSLSSTYTEGGVGNVNIANPSISFGSSTLQFRSSIEVPFATGNSSAWSVYQSGLLIYYHRYNSNP